MIYDVGGTETSNYPDDLSLLGTLELGDVNLTNGSVHIAVGQVRQTNIALHGVAPLRASRVREWGGGQILVAWYFLRKFSLTARPSFRGQTSLVVFAAQRITSAKVAGFPSF